MPPYKIADFEKRVGSIVQDTDSMINGSDVDDMIVKAITDRYSFDQPREAVADVAADGTADLPLPVTAAPGSEGFEDGFSQVRQLEYPIGNVPETLLLDSDWKMYRSPTGLKVRLFVTVPPAGALVRTTFTLRHLADGSTVYGSDFEAVCDYVASLVSELLAARYAKTRDNTVSADVVNYRTKSQEYLAMAKAQRLRYFNHFGITEGQAGAEAQQGPAISIGDMDNIMGSGLDRLIHNKYSR